MKSSLIIHIVLLQLLLGTATISAAATVDTVEVYSQQMKKNVRCVVVQPNSYPSTKKRYPVVYLLHGYSGNYAQWLQHAPQLAQQADLLQLILVCPDGGYNSWYLDSPVDSTYRYETFVARELPAWIDSRYRTIVRSSGRAITGLSMGGHGALYLAFRNKNVFSQAGSICGGMDLRPFPGNWDLKQRLGDTICCKNNWETHSVINLADSIRNHELRLIIDCGIDDFFLPVNRALHNKLLQLGIGHDYTERPGAHNRAYWSNAIDFQLLYFSKGFVLTNH